MNGQSDVKTSPASLPRIKYKHMAEGREFGNIYVYYGTPEWKMYADDYRSVTGAERLHDGIGQWFCRDGQAAKRKHRKAPSTPHADAIPKPRSFG